MADNADIATELMERRMEAALSSRLSLYIPNPDPECEDCGHEIPQARRNAAPWATTCIERLGIHRKALGWLVQSTWRSTLMRSGPRRGSSGGW